jgi:hypothetical protein
MTESHQERIRTPEEDNLISELRLNAQGFLDSVAQTGAEMPTGDDGSVHLTMRGSIFGEDNRLDLTDISVKPSSESETPSFSTFTSTFLDLDGILCHSKHDIDFVGGDVRFQETPYKLNKPQEPITRVNDPEDMQLLKRFFSEAPERIAVQDKFVKSNRERFAAEKTERDRLAAEPGYKKLGRKVLKAISK